MLQSAEIPLHGATGVATDTLITVFTRPVAARVTVVSSGVEVELQPVALPGLVGVQAFRPRAPLPAEQEIRVGDSRTFRTGAATAGPADAWELADSRFEVVSSGGCGAHNSCEGNESLQLALRPKVAGAAPLFALFRGDSRGGLDPAQPLVSLLPAWPDEKGVFTLWINASAGVRRGDELFVAPVGPAGDLGELLGPVFFRPEDDSGCAALATRPGSGFLSLLLLAGLMAAARPAARRR